VKVAFTYPNPRTELLEDIAAGRAPDTPLLGQNHLADFGVDAEVVDSALRRTRRRQSGLVHRLTWNARELTLPFELRRFDVVCTPLATLLPLVARTRRGPRVVLISYHLLALHRRLGGARRRLLEASVRSAAAVVCVSEAARERTVERLGLDPARAHTAQLGIDTAWWRPAPPAHDGYVLTVGRDLARDYGTFAAALELLPDVRGIVCAKRENVEGLHVPSNVEVRLDASPAELRTLYAGAACVVVPIRSEDAAVGTENSGTIAALEAMACARPVVVSQRAYLNDYVEDGTTALTVPPEERTALSDTVARVLGDAALADRLASAARDRIESRFTTHRLAERLAGVLSTLAA
jgi:glycosyltransferase involved in cell wall biosynthesis